jgi:hypothetical protein
MPLPWRFHQHFHGSLNHFHGSSTHLHGTSMTILSGSHFHECPLETWWKFPSGFHFPMEVSLMVMEGYGTSIKHP